MEAPGPRVSFPFLDSGDAWPYGCAEGGVSVLPEQRPYCLTPICNGTIVGPQCMRSVAWYGPTTGK